MTVTTAVATFILTTAFLFDQSTPARAGDEVQANPKAQSPGGVNESAFAVDFHWTLKIDRDRMINLANPPVRRADSTGTLKEQLVSLRVEVKSAEIKFENAKLARELAEIAVNEYEQGTFVQDKATLNGERLLAVSDVKMKRDLLDLAKDQLVKINSLAKNTPADSARESRRRPSGRAGDRPAPIRACAGKSWVKNHDHRSLYEAETAQGAPIPGREGPCRGAGAPSGLGVRADQNQIVGSSNHRGTTLRERAGGTRCGRSSDAGLTGACDRDRREDRGHARSTRDKRQRRASAAGGNQGPVASTSSDS